MAPVGLQIFQDDGENRSSPVEDSGNTAEADHDVDHAEHGQGNEAFCAYRAFVKIINSIANEEHDLMPDAEAMQSLKEAFATSLALGYPDVRGWYDITRDFLR